MIISKLTKDVKMSQDTKKLTSEQRDKIPEYADKYIKIGTSTARADRPKLEKLFHDLYVDKGREKPVVLWEDSLTKAAILAAKLKKHPQGETLPVDEILKTLPTVSKDEIIDMSKHASFGSFNAYWVAYYDFAATEVKKVKDPSVEILKTLAEECAAFWAFKRAIVVSEKPTKMLVNDDFELDCKTGKALEFADGTGVYAVNGTIGSSLIELLIQNKFGV